MDKDTPLQQEVRSNLFLDWGSIFVFIYGLLSTMLIALNLGSLILPYQAKYGTAGFYVFWSLISPISIVIAVLAIRRGSTRKRLAKWGLGLSLPMFILLVVVSASALFEPKTTPPITQKNLPSTNLAYPTVVTHPTTVTPVPTKDIAKENARIQELKSVTQSAYDLADEMERQMPISGNGIEYEYYFNQSKAALLKAQAQVDLSQLPQAVTLGSLLPRAKKAIDANNKEELARVAAELKLIK